MFPVTPKVPLTFKLLPNVVYPVTPNVPPIVV